MHAAAIKIEVLVANGHVALRDHRDERNVDGVFHVNIGRVVHNRLHIRPAQLCRPIRPARTNLFHHLGYQSSVVPRDRLQVSGTAQSLEFAMNHLERRLGDFLFRLCREERCLDPARRSRPPVRLVVAQMPRIDCIVGAIVTACRWLSGMSRPMTMPVRMIESGIVGVVDDLLEPVVGDDGQPVHVGDARALAVGQAQAAANGLLDQGLRVRRPQRNDGVEVGDVPALLEHVDVDDDLGRVVGSSTVSSCWTVSSFSSPVWFEWTVMTLPLYRPSKNSSRLDHLHAGRWRGPCPWRRPA